jgi:hypothetical protein
MNPQLSRLAGQRNVLAGLFAFLQCGLLMLVAGTASASTGGGDYRCTIERFSQAQGDVGSTYQLLSTSFVGKQFTIDRSSGITAGALKNSVGATPKVIDRGNKDNSFKVVSSIGSEQGMPGTTLTALNVMEFIEGNKKPFNFMINDGVFFGTCEAF